MISGALSGRRALVKAARRLRNLLATGRHFLNGLSQRESIS
jgi:hypothetical protein